MFKSLRWRLQVWHAVVLMIVVTSFGAVVYDLLWRSRLQQVDAELYRNTNFVMSVMRRWIPNPQNRRPRPPGENEQPPVTDQNATASASNPAATNPPAAVAASTSAAAPVRTDSPPQNDRPDPGSLPAEFDQLFQGDDSARSYFIIWGNTGQLLHKSESAPDLPCPNLEVRTDGLPQLVTRERRADHDYRELVRANGGRFKNTILVGRSLEKDLAAQHQSGLMLVVTGLVILAAGVLGGGWLSARVIRPLDAMTETAESISAQNLSQRLNVKEADTELGKLATVLNRTFDRLQEAFERQSQFTADASHELRTPLSVISSHTELALLRPRTNEEYRAALETCQRASKRMRSLIDALLVLARFDSGMPSMNLAELDIEPVIQDCVSLVKQLADEHGIQLQVDVFPCEVRGDWDRLAQVFTNLLTNAIRYNVESGRINISCHTEERFAVISIADTGIGIAPDQLPRIFDRFYQVNKARTWTEGSCGLGLAICKTIIDAHGGSITAQSRLEAGTTIEVRLPLANQPRALDKPKSSGEILVAGIVET